MTTRLTQQGAAGNGSRAWILRAPKSQIGYAVGESPTRLAGFCVVRTIARIDTSKHSPNGRFPGRQGNLLPDAFLAALAIGSGSEWITTDEAGHSHP